MNGLLPEMAIKSLVKYKEAEFCVGVNAEDGKSLVKYNEAQLCVGVNAGDGKSLVELTYK